MIKILIYNSTILILSILPLSYLLIQIIDNTILKKQKNLENINVILLGIKNILIKDYLTVKSIYFNNQIIKITQNTETITNEYTKQIAVINFIVKNIKNQKIENTISNFFTKMKINKSNFEKEFKFINKVKESKDKRNSTYIVQNNSTKEIFAFTKGNPYEILNKCTRVLENNEKINLTSQKKQKIKKEIEKLNKKGQKIIGYAMKALPIKILAEYTENFTEKELIFIGFIGVANPINQELEKNIKEIQKNGVKIYVTTELKERNAIAISQKLKIINPKHFESITKGYLETILGKKLSKKIIEKKDMVFSELDKSDYSILKNEFENNNLKTLIINKKNSNNIKDIFQTIEKRKQYKLNNSKLIIQSFSTKIPLVVLTIIATIIGIPSPISIGLILILDLIINLNILLNLRHSATKNQIKIKSTLFINMIIFSLIVCTLIFWNIIKQGLNILNESYEIESLINRNTTTLIFTQITILSIISGIYLTKFKKKTNKILIPSIILNSLILYIILRFSISNKLILTNIISKNQLIIIFIFSSIYVLILILKEIYEKLLHKSQSNS